MDDLNRRARKLRDVVEPLAAGIYFAPEAHQAYTRLGFGPSPGTNNGVALPDGVAYFTSRGACLGPVPGEVVAAAFGVFNPAVVVPAVGAGWALTTPPAVLAAREEGAVASLGRMLGPRPEGMDQATEILRRGAEGAGVAGRHLFAGLRSLGYPDHPVGALWRAADLVREHRGDGHISAWVAAGFDAVEIGLLTELWWGLPPKTYVRSRAWSSDQLDAGLDRLRSAGLVAGVELTGAGRARREEVEAATDAAAAPVLRAIGDDFDQLVSWLEPWARAIVAAGGYPRSAGDLIGRREG